ncbi:MAG: glycosyltransferase family 2 protein [Chloroflexota bacterium]
MKSYPQPIPISIIILNWNAADDTIACVQKCMSWRQVSPQIWVVDNASEGQDVELIRQACPTITVIENAENQGFSGGSNRGIEAALEAHKWPILLLNNDATIDEAHITRLVNTLDNDYTIGIVGPALYDAEMPDTLLSVGGKNPVLYFQTRHRQLIGEGPLFEVNNVSGTAVLIRADIFERSGLLDEAYFFSTEMADFCARAKGYGFNSVIDTRAKAHHTISRSANHRSTLYVYYIVRNRFIYLRKFYGSFVKYLLLLFWASYSAALMIKLRLSGETATATAVRLALLDGLLQRFGGQNARVMAACQANDSAPKATVSTPTS